MALLVIVFLIPWLEDQTRLRRAAALLPLHLDAPWSIFYGLLVAVALDELPAHALRSGECGPRRSLRPRVPRHCTRVLAAFPPRRRLALGRLDIGPRPRDRPRERCAAPEARSNCERLWFWFRDNWGVVWALRVLERFNRAAEVSHWPVRLTWFGIVSPPGEAGALPPASPEELEVTFRNLMKRFADSRGWTK